MIMIKKILLKYTNYMKENVITFFKPVKRLFIISLLYNIFTISMIYLFGFESIKEKIILAIASFISYYVIWGITTVIMICDIVERPLPLIKSKFIRKPGRYFSILNLFYFELKTSPVNDLYYSVFVFFIMYIICFINMIIQRVMLAFIFLNILFCLCISILKECNRLEVEYQDNLKKAKIIFMECLGDRQLLKDNEMYYTYQVDSYTEQCWYKELQEKNDKLI